MSKSMIGFHYSIGGNKNGVGEFMKKLNEAGIPFLMKGCDDAGLCFEGQKLGKEKGVNNWLIYRVSTNGQRNGVEYDVPDYTKSPKEAAEEHWNKTIARWPKELEPAVVWMEPINEPRAKRTGDDVQWQQMHPTDWLGAFMLEYAKIANANGHKVCGPSFNSGEPEVFTSNDYELPGMLAYLRYCAANPDKAALSVHEYIWDRWTKGEKWADWYPTLWGRVEAAIAAADKHGIPRTFAIFMTEWGFAHDRAPLWPECEPHLTAYNQWAARWPQVKGVAAWSLQGGWGSVDNDVQSWFAPLADYAVNGQFNPGQQPARTHARFGSTISGSQPTPMSVSMPVPPAASPPAGLSGATNAIQIKRVNSPAGLWLRSAPIVAEETKIRLIPDGTAVEVLEEGVWNRVRLGDLTGFAFGQFLVAGDVPVGEMTAAVPSITPSPAAVPAHAVIDLLPYIKGDGRQYEVQNASGGQERFQTQEEANAFYQVKNAQWEQFFFDDNFIYRDIDTSPGGGRFYRLKDADRERGSRWLPRKMAVGQTHTQARQVQFYQKDNGSPSAANSGSVTDTIKLVARHAKYKFQTGLELDDVLELTWVNGGENYFYARGFGLVGWARQHQDPNSPAWSAVSEIHPPGAREPFGRERIKAS